MKLSNFAIDNKVAVYILILILVIMGWTAYTNLPREASPDITVPFVIVTVPYVGVAPSEMEGLVAQPLERAIKSLKDIKQIRSVCKEGVATISVEFNTGVDIDEALRRVRDKVNSTRNQLPQDILEPIISEINLSEFPIMIVNVMGDVGIVRLKDIAEKLQDRIEGIPGVLRADISGNLTPEVQVNCDVHRLNAYQISFDDVVGAIRAENLTVPGGVIDNGERTFSVRIPGEYKQVKPIEDIVVKIFQGKPIYVRDVASVEYGFEDRQTYARLNGEDVVQLQVRKRAGENLIRIADEVKSVVKDEQKKLGSLVTLEVSSDQSKFIRSSVKELENSILTGMFLVILSLFMFFGFKNSVLISTAIPLSMFVGFIAVSAWGITLNFVVLFSLVLVLGILVDDAIVVIENIYRHQQEYDKPPLQAAKDGVKEVAVPVLTSTLSTIAPFIPLLFWPGIVGEFMWFLPTTLILMMTGSLFTAFIISPVQGAVWINYKKEIRKTKERLAHPHWYYKYNPFSILYHEVDEKFFPWMQKMYVKTLAYTLKRKKLTLAITTAVFALVMVIFGMFNAGVNFFPITEPRFVNVNVETPVGTSLDVTNKAVLTMEDRIRTVGGYGDIEFMSASSGTSNDFFDFSGQGTPNKGSIAISFRDKEDRRQSTWKSLEEIRTVARNLPGADMKVTKQEMGPPVGAAVSIEISGEDYAVLAELSEKLMSQIKNTPGLVDLKDDFNPAKPEVEIDVDREKAGILYSSTGQIAGTIRSAITGAEASKYRIGEDEYKIRVRLQKDQRLSVDDIEQLHISFMNRRGEQINLPVVAVADIVKSGGISEIRRKDQKRVITVTGNVEGRVAGDVISDVKAKSAGFPMPEGYGLKFTGQDEEQQKASAFLMRAFVITILIVFLIIVTQFNSVKVPLVIMLTVPLALIGVLLGLVVTKTAFSVIMTGVGVISLVGIVTKNAIVLLDFAKQRMLQGESMEEALLEAGRTRLRPIMLTAATTVLGVLPLATGVDFSWTEGHFVIGAESASFWGPLGVAIISGLTVSSFLTLVIVPVVYMSLETLQVRITAYFRKLFKREEVAGVSAS